MRDKKSYTVEQAADSDELAKLMAKIPREQRGQYLNIVEAMMLGAEIAKRALSNAG